MAGYTPQPACRPGVAGALRSVRPAPAAAVRGQRGTGEQPGAGAAAGPYLAQLRRPGQPRACPSGRRNRLCPGAYPDPRQPASVAVQRPLHARAATGGWAAHRDHGRGTGNARGRAAGGGTHAQPAGGLPAWQLQQPQLARGAQRARGPATGGGRPGQFRSAGRSPAQPPVARKRVRRAGGGRRYRPAATVAHRFAARLAAAGRCARAWPAGAAGQGTGATAPALAAAKVPTPERVDGVLAEPGPAVRHAAVVRAGHPGVAASAAAPAGAQPAGHARKPGGAASA
ncbi:hypothetical protein D3C79_673010 [compost metagenome]